MEQDINNYQGSISIRLDKTCMDATDRYKVFREDGYEDPDVPPWAIKLVLQNEDVLAEETLL